MEILDKSNNLTTRTNSIGLQYRLPGKILSTRQVTVLVGNCHAVYMGQINLFFFQIKGGI